jgi:hypothetical protein
MSFLHFYSFHGRTGPNLFLGSKLVGNRSPIVPHFTTGYFTGNCMRVGGLKGTSLFKKGLKYSTKGPIS